MNWQCIGRSCHPYFVSGKLRLTLRDSLHLRGSSEKERAASTGPGPTATNVAALASFPLSASGVQASAGMGNRSLWA